MRGEETQHKANEALQQAKPKKYTKRKTIHLLYLCGLKINERKNDTISKGLDISNGQYKQVV